jgi:hypothetical protein
MSGGGRLNTDVWYCLLKPSTSFKLYPSKDFGDKTHRCHSMLNALLLYSMHSLYFILVCQSHLLESLNVILACNRHFPFILDLSLRMNVC